MSDRFDELRVCPKCHGMQPLSAFKLRSKSQSCAPSWCRGCVNLQARVLRARERQLAASELLRRIRFGSPAKRVYALLGGAARLSGGVDVLSRKLDQQLRSGNLRIALSAATMVLKLTLAQNASRSTN